MQPRVREPDFPTPGRATEQSEPGGIPQKSSFLHPKCSCCWGRFLVCWLPVNQIFFLSAIARVRSFLVLAVFLNGVMTVRSSDWPQWRFDAGRTASSPEQLPASLQLMWKKDFPKRLQVWDDPLNHDMMPYDRVLEPVVLGDRIIAGFNDSDKVVAWDIESGREIWRFYTDGPVRFPPACADGRVCFVSDDGTLYCVKSSDGELLWKLRGGPGPRKVLGNERVVSAWPARGGPVIRDGKVYFAASIWPFMGTFIYALDAATGEVEWVNDGNGSEYTTQPHGAPSFAGVAPQGALVATSDRLIVPGGRSVPAVFDRGTGALQYFHMDAGGKGHGGSFVAATETEFFVHTRVRGVRAYDMAKGGGSPFYTNEPVLDGGNLYSSSDFSLRETLWTWAGDALSYTVRKENEARTALEKQADAEKRKAAQKTLDAAMAKTKIAQAAVDKLKTSWRDGWQGGLVQAHDAKKQLLWEIETDATGDLIKAGNRLYAAGADSIVALDLDPNGGAPAVSWSYPVKGSVQRLLAANGMLFAVTLEGALFAFGEHEAVAPVVEHSVVSADETVGTAQSMFDVLLSPFEGEEGYALCFGLENEAVLESLVHRTRFHVVGVDPDPERVAALRARYDRGESLYGKRIVFHQGTPVDFMAPPYIATLVVVGEEMAGRLLEPGWLEAVYDSVRPYGGSLWVTPSADADLESFIRSAGLLKAAVESVSLQISRKQNAADRSRVLTSLIQVTREGALPGAADWTHQYGDIANTVKSDDQRVKLPLGLLWFGGSSNMDVLPRHGHGPPEQVVGGRAIIEGMDSLSARDVYTGRVIWKRTIENLDTYGIYFNDTYTNTPLSIRYNQTHIPGANGRGANYVATEELVYVALEDYCEVLDAATGKTERYIRLPLKEGGAVRPRWGFIGVYGDVLLGGHDFANYSRKAGVPSGSSTTPIEDLSASDGLVAFDRHTGGILWKVQARHSFLHNGIVAGNGRVYILDKLPKSAEGKMSRRGKVKPETYRVLALDARTGKQLWESSDPVFGTWLGYSEEHDILLQAGARAGDRLPDEVGQGMLAFRGATGEVLWKDLDRSYGGPCILHHELIMTSVPSRGVSSGVFNLLDGTPHWVTNPMTGEMEPWLIQRAYGCNTPVAGENMLTFRSGAAGFYDLNGKSGTGNLGGFKSSCTSNLVIANGVLNAPDYTRTCTCGYQNQTSLALIHMPDVELWTTSQLGAKLTESQTVSRAGINFGAPGDRLSDQGTLWLEFPAKGGDSPDVGVKVEGKDARYVRHHSSMIRGEGLKWVAASGVEDAESIIVTPRIDPPKKASTKPDDGKGKAKTPEETEPSPDTPTRAYTVRLHFAELKKIAEGERRFGVRLQGEPVLEDFDVVREAGGARRCLTREFKGIRIGRDLRIEFARADETKLGPLISGVELIAEDPL
jgi:outer membrane protein assembly factor BamB